MRNITIARAFFLLILANLYICSYSYAITADEIIKRVESNLNGETAEMEISMEIFTSRTSRTMKMKSYSVGDEKSFIKITYPKKDQGITFLKIDKGMWQYVPKIEKIIKIPASMMLQSWMGSDFTNDDLVKEGSFVEDYQHQLLGEREVSGTPTFAVELLPKPEAAVVWGKVIYCVRKSDLAPQLIEYFDEQGELVRRLEYSDFQQVGGRVIPTTWQMIPADKPGKKTTIVVRQVEYDQPIDSEIFTRRNLGRAIAANL